MCRNIAKYTLFTVNLLLTLLGLCVAGLGIYLAIRYGDLFYRLLGIHYDTDWGSIIIITIGVLMFIVSLIGCCGAIKESKCALNTYAIMLGILAVVKIGVTIFLFVRMSKIEDNVRTNIDQSFNDPAQNAAFHALEATFKCCGTTGPESYINYNNVTAPTCCDKFNNDPTTADDDANRFCSIDDAFPVGCTPYISRTVYEFLRTVAFVSIGLIVFELLVMLLALYVSNTITLPAAVDTPTTYDHSKSLPLSN